MAFSFGYSPWLLLLCVAVAGGLTYWTYRATVPSLSAGWRLLLGGLRFLALALICFLLFEPVLQQFQSTERPPVLAVLLDDSQSMQVVANGDTSAARPSAARSSVRPVVDAFQDEAMPGTTRFFRIGDGAPRGLSGSVLDSLRFDDARTDLANGLQAAPEELRSENLGGIVLVSDGQYNTGQNPLRVADRSPVPVHTVTVGDTTRQRDLRIQSVTTNERAYLNSSVPVRVTLSATEGPGQPVSVTLEQAGRTLDQRQVRLPSGTGEASVDLTFEPKQAGRRQLTVRVPQLSGEVTTRNNAQSVSLRVLESKRQVLVLGAAPSPNVSALRRVYDQTADTEVTTRIPTPEGSFLEGPLPDDLSSFDVVVLAGFPSTSVPDDITQRVATLVDDGTPALFFLDRQTDLSAWTEHFDAVLPARPDAPISSFSEASFRVVESARQHPVFRIEDAEGALFERLPPLQIPTSAWTPTPDAQVLGTAATTSAPLLVLRRRAGLRTAVLLGSGVWRWALLPSELRAADPLWPGLASNLLRWASTEADDSPVRVRPTASTFGGTDAASFTGRVYDESMQPVSEATVDVTVTDSTGTEYPYTMDPAGQGRYTLDIGTLPEGTYQYDAQARLGEANLGTDQGTFSVAPLRIEYQSPRADAVLMRQLASRSGGASYTPQTVDRLPEKLSGQASFSNEVVQQSSEAELWRTSLFLIAILALLASEWTLRKFFGLT
ncbi:vWA domain-containing protein [Salinibacter grassmerensis]|uniref:vWA domain-containing protein n=1 Tax=Salinibacter grassmerensis TaxID=3040353 RepID=UPI0021E7364A|nr:vWA domain-containing protein [Salinibacter grassmerensis]